MGGNGKTAVGGGLGSGAPRTVGGASVTPTNMPPLKKKTTVVKQSVPPPVPPRGSPKFNKTAGSGRPGGTSGSLPSQSSGHRGRSSAGKRQRSSPRGRGNQAGFVGASEQKEGKKDCSAQARLARSTALDPLQENDAGELQLVPSPNKVLSWLSSNDFRVSENGDILSDDVASEVAQPEDRPQHYGDQEVSTAITIPKVIAVKRKPLTSSVAVSSNVREASKTFERLSSRNGSGSSVQQMIRNFERTAATTVVRSESMYSRVPSHCASKDPSAGLPVVPRTTRTLPLTIPIIKETLVEDENNNIRPPAIHDEQLQQCTTTFIPMAERLETDNDLTAHENDQLVLANLKNVVKARRELFTSSPGSTMERKLCTMRPTIPNGAVVQREVPVVKPKTLPVQGKRPPPASSRIDQDAIQRKIEEIEAEIRQNEERLNRIPSKRFLRRENVNMANKPTLTTERPVGPCRNDSFLSRLKPKTPHRNGLVAGIQDYGLKSTEACKDVRFLRKEEKVSIIRQIGLPLDENHNLESYLEQFSTSPSCSSTPPPAFDDISEHGSSSHRHSSDDKTGSSSGIGSAGASGIGGNGHGGGDGVGVGGSGGGSVDRRSTSCRSDNYKEDSIRYVPPSYGSSFCVIL
uniref:Uncharacterized protein n=1 Tax=Anopheles maculatus TaxID=74869 RepID=A0A182SQ76_9DIPT